MNNEDNTNVGFDLSFIKAFLDNCEKQNRFNISVISSICLELSDSGDDCDEQHICKCTDKIINQCSQMMKLTEIYSLLSDILDEKEFISEYINIPSYLSQFTSECNNLLKESCSISYTGGENVSSDVIKRLLEFILVMHVRKSVLSGARAIEISSSIDNGEITINLRITNNAETVYFNIPETFSIDFSEEIICKATNIINGKYIIENNEMKLIFPVCKSDSARFNSTAKSYGKPLFSTINNILSDLGDISLI